MRALQHRPQIGVENIGHIYFNKFRVRLDGQRHRRAKIVSPQAAFGFPLL